MRCFSDTFFLLIALLAPDAKASDSDRVEARTVTASGRILRREPSELGLNSLVEEHRAASISAQGLISSELEISSWALPQPPAPPGLLGGGVGRGYAKSGDHDASLASANLSTEDIMDDVHRTCLDGLKSRRTPRSGEGAATSVEETCQEMMFASRKLRVNTCWDRRDGAGLRNNCKRTCGCCCPDEHGSGTHDNNGIEVTCRQLIQWTGLYKYDYCADPAYGGAIRSKCKGLCCTCTPAMEWLAGYSYGNSTQSGHMGDKGPQPLIELTDDINEARRLVSELAESVDSIAGELPRLGALIVGIHGPKAEPSTVGSSGSLESKVEDEYKGQWGAADVPPPEQGTPASNDTSGQAWVSSPKYWSPTAQSEAAAQATPNASDAQVPPPERAGADTVASAPPTNTTWREEPGVLAAHKAATGVPAGHISPPTKREVDTPFGTDRATATAAQDVSGTDGKTSGSALPPFTPAQPTQ